MMWLHGQSDKSGRMGLESRDAPKKMLGQKRKMMYLTRLREYQHLDCNYQCRRASTLVGESPTMFEAVDPKGRGRRETKRGDRFAQSQT